jgi:hypothetical protein
MHLTGDGRSFLERVRLFSAAELEHLLADSGLAVRQRAGDYDGSALGDNSPRAILRAERV